MLLQHNFDIDIPASQAWELLTDLEQVARCMPGAVLDAREGRRYLGSVKVTVGPVTALFKGSAAFVEQEPAAHRAVIEATGKDPRGGAAAAARIRAHLETLDPSRTRVALDTDLDISGRVAQFGRGALADVSHRLLNQFAANLNAQLRQAGDPAPAAHVAGATSGSSDSIDGLRLLAPVVRDRGGPVVGGALFGFVVSWLLFRARPRR